MQPLSTTEKRPGGDAELVPTFAVVEHVEQDPQHDQGKADPRENPPDCAQVNAGHLSLDGEHERGAYGDQEQAKSEDTTSDFA